jgi:hypothetical protein
VAEALVEATRASWKSRQIFVDERRDERSDAPST